MTLWEFLVDAVGPLAIKVLAAVGISLVTFIGVDSVVNGLLGHMSAAWAGLSGDAAALLGLGGVGKALGLGSGAITARLALWSAASSSRWVAGDS